MSYYFKGHSNFSVDKKPHDFLTEMNDEFNKGEIIKLINSGYKHDDVVLIRANEIAAR